MWRSLTFSQFYLEVGPGGLQALHVELLEVEQQLLDSAAVAAAAEAAGSTAGWAGGLTSALALPGGCELDR